jgi:hypothetical protein
LNSGGIKLCRYCGARPLYILLNNCSFLLGRLLYNGSQPVSKYKESDHKHLGVTLSHDAKWSEHVENIAKTISKHLGVLRKLKF